jgi:hypothetical protein
MNLGTLESLAKAATPGPWWIDSHGLCMSGLNHKTVFITDSKAMGTAVRHTDTGNLSHWRNDNDASFIAAANPETILALIALVREMGEALEDCISLHRRTAG